VIHRANSGDVEFVRTLFQEYADGIGVDLSFQDFDSELADPLGFYELVLVSERGCVALRRVDDETCEMKRLYVRPEARRKGLGRTLAESAIAHARAIGFDRMLLDTLPSMAEARDLYTSLGFRETDAYRHNPVEGTSFLALEL